MSARIALGVSAVLIGSLLVAPPASAEPGAPASASVSLRSVPVGGVPVRAVEPAPSQLNQWSPGSVVWPAAGVAEVDLPPAGPDGAGLRVRAGASPVWVGRAAGAAPGRVRVQVLDQAASRSAGVAGVLLRVLRANGGSGAGPVSVAVDVSGFAGAFGGDWVSRLRLVRLPGCVLSEPAAPGCATPVVVTSSVVDEQRLRLTAVVDAAASLTGGGGRGDLVGTDGTPAQAGVLGVVAVSGGERGDFRQSPYAVSGEWQAGTSAGDFSWSYEMGVPPVPGALVPGVGLSYSSGAVDGQTAGRNVQPGVAGEGWQLGSAFIQRSYRSCVDDTANSPVYGNTTFDWCWRLPNAQLVWGGRAQELVVDDATGQWHAAEDDGMRVQLFADADWAAATTVFSPGDFTGDGKSDVLFQRAADYDLYLVKGDGAGGWLEGGAASRVGSFDAASHLFSVGDFTGDGKADVLWRRASDGLLFLNAGTGTGGVAGSVQIGSFSSANLLFGAGDFSGDGHPDVLWRHWDNRLMMTRGNGSGGFVGASVQIGTGWGGHDLIFSPGDFTGDGKTDVITRNATTKNLVLYRGSGTGGFANNGTQILTGPATADAAFSGGDHSGDGKPDVLWRHGTDRDVRLVAGNGTGGFMTGVSVNITDAVRLGNGDNDGERWRITTTDGTQYWFGRHELPGHTAGARVSNSVLTAPVFGNHYGEPCHRTGGFGGAWCAQAWRWQLDHVVDPAGNAMTYFYARESNRTGLAGSATTTSGYDRGGYLVRIEYGLRSGQELATAPARVLFDYAERCLSACWSGTPWVSTPTAASWPDTPWDLQCAAAPCSTNVSPSFFTTRRLALVTTQTWTGSGTNYLNVDQWSLTHSFPATGNGTSPVLWLASLTRTGKANGGNAALPAVSFGGVLRDQRADYDPAGTMAQARKYRISSIHTETGGQILVGYSGTDAQCQFGAPFPDPDHNSDRCFAQWYQPQTVTEPAGFSWWHKYVVDTVTERDLVGGAPDLVHAYAYATTGASTGVLWAHDDGAATWSTPLARRSWGDWRGFPTVTVTTGPSGNQAQTRYLYFRGLKGDFTGAVEDRASTITNAAGEVWQDEAWRAGHLLQVQHFATSGGQELERSVIDPVAHPVAARTLATTWAIPTTHRAHINRVARERTWTWLAAAGGWRTTEVVNTWNPDGTIQKVDDLGDTTTNTDDRCTRTWYTPNTSAGNYLIDYPNRQQTVGVACGTTPTYPDDALADARLFYDGTATHGTAPTVGNVTRTEHAPSYAGSTPNYVLASTAGYDGWGRVTSTGDGLGRISTTVYTQGGAGLLTSMMTTNPAGHASVTTVDPAWGAPLTVTDANGNTTTGSYDPLGRLVKVWLPGRATTLTPNAEYGYSVTGTGATYALTKALGPNGNQILRYDIYDGLLRQRQTQSTAPDGHRVVHDTAYDARGNPVKTSTFYNNTSGPTGTLVSFADTEVETQHRATYDGLDRQLSDQLWSLGFEQWRTTTGYDGDRVNLDPPVGGTATMTIHDARGRTTAVRQYHGPSPSGSYDETVYSYDGADRLSRVSDPAGNDWEYTYDLLGRKLSTVDPDAGTSTSTYDNAGQLVTSTDARGQVLARTYDDLGRITSLRDDSVTGPVRASWVYDTLEAGQLTSSTRHVGGHTYTSAVTGYDDNYRPLGTTVTIPPVEANLAGSYTTSHTYTVNGAPAATTLPAVGGLPAETITATYTNTGRPETLTGLDSYVAATTYHWDGTPAQVIMGAVGDRVRLSTVLAAATRRLTMSLVDTEDQSTPGTYLDRSSAEYGYDQAGNVTMIAGKSDGVRDQAECFTTDHLRRATEAWTQATTPCTSPQHTGVDPYWLTWTYDQSGNRLTQLDHDGAGDTTTTYTHPAAGGPQPHTLTQAVRTGATTGTDTYTYDNAGNTLTRQLAGQAGQTLTWDPEGHLATLTENGATTSYLYDANGARLIQRTDATITLYLDQTELALNTSTGVVNGTRYYDTAVRTVTGLTWQIGDHHGTGELSINPTTMQITRRRSLPFGGQRGTPPSAWPGTRGFLGGTTDPTGLTHLGAREYDPSTGRFLSLDPVLDLTDPQQMHGYTYGHNNPATYSDPTGLRDCADNTCQVVATPTRNRGRTIDGNVVDDTCRTHCGRDNPALVAPGGDNGDDTAPLTLAQGAAIYHKTSWDRLDPLAQQWVYTQLFCYNRPDICRAADRAADQAFTQFWLDLTGITDATNCANGSVSGCAWTVLAVSTWGLGRGLRPTTKGGRLIDNLQGMTPSLAANASSGADSALSGAQLNRHLAQLERYGSGGFRQLESGRIRYYGDVTPAAKPGEMVGRRLVREWDPANDATRTWHETLDQSGNIRIVRPETGGTKVHYYFDEFGSYGGSW